MAAPALTLDLPERQVLVDFFDDPNGLTWHQRMLLQATAAAGVWVSATPDHDVERIDLNRHRVLALGRNCAFPDGHRGQIYYFDPIADDDLRRLRQQGRDLLAVLGAPPAAAATDVAGGVWRVANTSSDSFGEEVPAQLLADAEQFIQAPAGGYEAYAVGLAYIDEAWTHVQLVEAADYDSWLRGLTTLAARDPRVIGDKRDSSGKRRFMDFKDSLNKYTVPKTPEFGLTGQRVTMELVTALSSSGMEWMSHHLDFVHKSGLSTTSGVCRSHRRVSETLQALQQIDQVNLPALVGVEILCRFLVQIETAVARNPKVPDFQDLDALVGSTVNEVGGLVLPEYNKFIAQAQQAEAFTLKQRRLWREEQWVDFRGGGGGGGGGGDGGKGAGRKGAGKDGGKGKEGGRGRGGRGGRGDGQAVPEVA
jgi:hypothetical protein